MFHGFGEPAVDELSAFEPDIIDDMGDDADDAAAADDAAPPPSIEPPWAPDCNDDDDDGAVPGCEAELPLRSRTAALSSELIEASSSASSWRMTSIEPERAACTHSRVSTHDLRWERER